MAAIRWTYESELWLKEIYDYISLDNHQAAREVVDGIYSTAQMLKYQPEMGYTYEAPGMGSVRILLYKHYRITYLILEDQIDILGVFHGALDIDKYL